MKWTNLNQSAGKLEAVLKQRTRAAFETLYDNLRIADCLLADTEFLAEFDDRYDDAVDHLQQQYFGVASHFLSLGELLDLFRTQEEQVWRTYKFDVRAVYAAALQERKAQTPEGGDEGTTRRSYKNEVKELSQELKMLSASQDKAQETIMALQQHIHELQSRVNELQGENRRLETENVQLRDENAYLRGKMSGAQDKVASA